MPQKNVVAIASPAPLDPADLLTPEELAAHLKVQPTWVYNALRNRTASSLPHFKMGRYLRFSWVEVSRWLQAKQQGA